MNRKPLSKKKTYLYGSFAIFLCLIGVFIITEVYVRITRDYKDLWVKTGRKIGENPMKKWYFIDAFSAYKTKPGVFFNKEGLNKTTNKHGFISSPEIDLIKPENTLRIVFLGGSSTAGVGGTISDEDTWPFLTSKILQAKYDDYNIEYLNGAQGGYSTFESYGRLWSRIRFFSPDIIILNHAWNEMYYFGMVDDMISWRTLPDGSWNFDKTSKKLGSYDPYWFDHIIRYSQLLTRLRLRITGYSDWVLEKSSEQDKDFDHIKDYDKRSLEIFRTNLNLIKESGKIINAKLFVVKQPTLVTSSTSEEDKKRCYYHYHGFGHDAHVDAFNQIYKIIEEEIDKEYIMDLTELSGISENFFDHVHPTELGARKIADLISKSLDNEIKNFKFQN